MNIDELMNEGQNLIGRITLQTNGSGMIILNFAFSIYYIINAKNFHRSLTTVVRPQNDTSKTANITYTIFNSGKSPKCRFLQ